MNCSLQQLYMYIFFSSKLNQMWYYDFRNYELVEARSFCCVRGVRQVGEDDTNRTTCQQTQHKRNTRKVSKI